MLLAKRIITGRSRRDFDQMDHFFDPRRHNWIHAALDVLREDPAFGARVVIESRDAGVDQPDHVLRAGWLRQVLILFAVKFAYESLRRGIVRNPPRPQPRGN